MTTLKTNTTAGLTIDTIIHGECVDTMDAMPERSVDLVFADPPYFMQLKDDLWRPNQTKVDAVDDDWDSFSGFDEYDLFTEDWLKAASRVMKDTATIWVMGSYHNIHRVGAIMQDQGFWILNEICWTKQNPTPNMKGTRFCNAHETLLWATKGEKHKKYTFHYKELKAAMEDKQMRSDWHIPICSGGERILGADGKKAHTTQKPEALLRRVILASTSPGDVILDPFSGTATTAAVAKKLGRHFIAIDMEEEYCEIGRRRVDGVVPEESQDATPLIGAPSKRVPFLHLVERGYLAAGAILSMQTTAPSGIVTATVNSDGTLSSGEVRGSIHKVGAVVQGLPACNGWTAWKYEAEYAGLLPIDVLRQQVIIDDAKAEPIVDVFDTEQGVQ